MQKYSLKSIYAKLYVEGDHVDWDKFIWNRISIPKHRAIAWLVMKNRLNTADRLLNYGLINDDKCQLCSTGRETHEHLFFQYSGETEEFQALRKKVLAAVMKAGVYFIWWARNEAVWNLVGWRPTQIVQRVKSLILLRISTVIPKKTSIDDRAWFDLLKSR
ncbi:uncharacterized protein LOC130589553 [Beta vulgaris subsp. vulgaris]|uniref:uncharacterized protein LOC130589553 n=1 Tax=Beta vulgaris subsp. vulgaris TaxID=3555 RepID=UPI0025484E2B|nr:uncharacterized protein LOC130589553 [Beta vulgaris subsp. vulgaris]